MIGLEDLRKLAQAIDAARRAGVRLHKACEIVGLDARTLQRWRAGDGLRSGDRRPLALRPSPAHAP